MLMLTGQAAVRPVAWVSSSNPASTRKIVMPATTMRQAICRVLRHSRVSHIRAIRPCVLSLRAGLVGRRAADLVSARVLLAGRVDAGVSLLMGFLRGPKWLTEGWVEGAPVFPCRAQTF